MELLKRIVSFLIYIICLYLFFARNMMNILNGTIIGSICGVIIFISLSASLFLANKKISTLSIEKQNNLLLSNTGQQTLSSYEKFLTIAKKYDSFMASKFNKKVVDDSIALTVLVWPFSTVTKKELSGLTMSFKEKYNHIDSSLKDSFAPTDLTYTKYKETIDEVTDVYSKNLAGIQKRLKVFNYREWSEDNIDDISKKYDLEVANLYNQNKEILNKFDNLIHELISLNDISDEPLKELVLLTEQTKNYKINED